MTKLNLFGRALEAHGPDAASRKEPLRLNDWKLGGPAMVSHDAALVTSAADASAAAELGYRMLVQTTGEPFILTDAIALSLRLPSSFAYLAPGDLVGFRPATGAVRILSRAASRHNWFFVTERCDNYCLMCSQPPRNVDDSWLLDEIEAALPLVAPTTPSLGFTGGEPLLRWREFVDVLSIARDALPHTALHVLSNGRAFSRADVARAWAGVQHPNLVAGIPLYAGVDATHDYVVQARGAFAETVEGILRLKDLGQRVEIRIVLHRITASRIVQTCRWIARNLPFVDHVALMGLENTGFALANDPILWIDPADYKKDVAIAVDILRSARVRVSIYNLPLCLIDLSAWDVAVQSISDWKNGYLEQCGRCSVRDRCAGFFTSGRPKFSDHIKPVAMARTVGLVAAEHVA